MKSSTRSQTNIQALRSDKRFDALAKRQEEEHQHLLSCHQKEMQELRDALNLSIEKFKSLSESTEMDLKDFKSITIFTLGALRGKMIAHETTVTEQKQTIEALNKQLILFHSLYFSRMEMDAFKKEVSDQMKEVTTCNINGYQECQSHLKSLLNSLREDLTQSKAATERKFCELIDHIERNYNVLKIDREGVLKEIRIWEKTIFIIEKKIENIYTLIERINKRGESCHKPE